MEINKSNRVKDTAFGGYQHKKTAEGTQAFEFNYMYDSAKYDCEVQFFRVGIDKKNNYYVAKGCDGEMEPFYTSNVPKEGVKIDPSYDLELSQNEPFAYRFVLKDKNSGEILNYPKEDGDKNEGCTLVTRRGTTVINQGPMYLASVDTLAPGYFFAGFYDKNTGALIAPSKEKKKEIADKIRNSNRSFSNTMGGTLAGIQAKIPELRKAGNKRIITLPLKGGDTVSSHKYWNQNNMLLAGGIGNINDYNSLQREVFKNGMNMVDDGTFTSEGLQGIHYQRAIKWMNNEEKPDEYYYFRMSGLQDNSLGLGVIPENFENLNHKVVNSPFDYVSGKDGQYKITENKNYDPKQPTVLQIFDDALVSDAQRNDKTSIIKTYDKVNTDNKLEMNTHDDTIMPYSFEINPYEYNKNVESLNEVNKMRSTSDKIKLNSPNGTMFAGSLSGISIEPKHEGGFVCWDANTDMVKLNYFTSNYDNELIEEEKNPIIRAEEYDNYRRANAQVQDMAVAAGRYWTRHVRNVHNEYTARTLGKISSNPSKAFERIEGILNTQNPDNPKLPEDVRLPKEVIKNILEDNYQLREKTNDYDILLTSSLMELPLDSIEFAPDTQGALSSPYLMKRSPDFEHIGESRYDAMRDETYKVPKKYAKTYNKMNEVFTDDIHDFAGKVMSEFNASSSEKIMTDDGELTEYGQYVIPLAAQDIAKYAVVKALMPQIGIKMLPNGEIAYDYDTMLEKGTLRNLGINGENERDEANQIVNKIKNGVEDLNIGDVKFIAASMQKRFDNTNANSFKLAEAMVDRSGLGLDWRLDAAKDVADMDTVRNAGQAFDTGWNNMIGFWAAFINAVKEENPNSYTVAEITDVGELIDAGKPDDGDVIYDNPDKALNALIDLAGITSEANYSYFFNGISNLFSRDFASGDDMVGNKDEERVNKLEETLGRFAAKPIDYKRNSYTFAGNHDKTRMIHALSMDMDLFHSDLSDKQNYNQRKTAYMIMNDIMNENEISEDSRRIIASDDDYFNNVSSKAVANGELLRSSIGSVNEVLKNTEKERISKSNLDEAEKQQKYRETDNKYNAVYAALSKSVADIVNGKYYKTDENNHDITVPDSTRKISEKDGFGSKPIPAAFDIVYDQAEAKYGLGDKLNGDDLNLYRDMVDSKATEVGRAKTRIIMRYLTALSGNPTLYGGDELGMTGYEDKCKNTYLQNRNALDWSIVEDGSPNKREDIAEYKKSLEDISRTRMDDDMNRLEALNNGTLYKLDRISGYVNGSDARADVSALLSQASNGAMSVSVLNPNGITTESKVKPEDIKPKDVYIDSIYLKTADNKISLDKGTRFRNINPDDKSIYAVCNKDDDYYIKRVDNGREYGIVLDGFTAPDGVLMLYHLPENVENERAELSAKKAKAREYFNQTYNIQNDGAYKNKPDVEQGRNVDVISEN